MNPFKTKYRIRFNGYNQKFYPQYSDIWGLWGLFWFRWKKFLILGNWEYLSFNRYDDAEAWFRNYFLEKIKELEAKKRKSYTIVKFSLKELKK